MRLLLLLLASLLLLLLCRLAMTSFPMCHPSTSTTSRVVWICCSVLTRPCCHRWEATSQVLASLFIIFGCSAIGPRCWAIQGLLRTAMSVSACACQSSENNLGRHQGSPVIPSWKAVQLDLLIGWCAAGVGKNRHGAVPQDAVRDIMDWYPSHPAH